MNPDLSADEHHKKNMEPSIFVGFIGPFNRGKTFLLSELSGRYLQQGFESHTKGINVVYTNDAQFIDTAGTGEALKAFKSV